MTKPLSLETILHELPDDDEMWVPRDQKSGKYLVIPDDRTRGRRPIRSFMSRDDTSRILNKVLDSSDRLRGADVLPVKILLKPAIRGNASDKNSDHADSSLVHSTNGFHES